MLTGDRDYAHLIHANAKQVDHLVATHHGARFNAGAVGAKAKYRPLSTGDFLRIS
ncbi:hypothetical protein [Bradyrhizobium sp. CCBAU 51765]|uniref:hypothetical protein n=1 Tax=Bradyrhizobium sp. CCBAU 51765 TaxID=1325102 RepID=UPI0018877C0B|nr:hypothetical protein [Bradyrhizobium sp. CCBAU 51765]